MSKPDTSTKAVEDFASWLGAHQMERSAAILLRALLAERDAAHAMLAEAHEVLKLAGLAMVAYHRLTLGDRLSLADRIRALLAQSERGL